MSSDQFQNVPDVFHLTSDEAAALLAAIKFVAHAMPKSPLRVVRDGQSVDEMEYTRECLLRALSKLAQGFEKPLTLREEEAIAVRTTMKLVLDEMPSSVTEAIAESWRPDATSGQVRSALQSCIGKLGLRAPVTVMPKPGMAR